MARRYKTFISDNIYFITFTILGWKKIFLNDEYCGLVYKWFEYAKEKYNNKIYGYVIMPNHVHCLTMITDKSAKLPILMMNAKRFMAYGVVDFLQKENNNELLDFFAINARTRDKAKHRIFTDRYDSLAIQSQKLFLEKLNYIHNNPCQEKWRLAEKPEDYKYSSAANYILGKGYYDIEVMDF